MRNFTSFSQNPEASKYLKIIGAILKPHGYCIKPTKSFLPVWQVCHDSHPKPNSATKLTYNGLGKGSVMIWWDVSGGESAAVSNAVQSFLVEQALSAIKNPQLLE